MLFALYVSILRAQDDNTMKDYAQKSNMHWKIKSAVHMNRTFYFLRSLAKSNGYIHFFTASQYLQNN